MIEGNKIKACRDELVIESVIKKVVHIEPFSFRLVSIEYKLQTFFGNDIWIEVDANGLIIDFALCHHRNVDWEDGEEHIPKRIEKVNKDIARLYANDVKVEVIIDDNWRRE